MGSHGKYVGKCTVFVGICCEMVVDNLLSEIFMIVEQRLWPNLYRFKWQNACARKKNFWFWFSRPSCICQLTFSHLSWFARYTCNSHQTRNDLRVSQSKAEHVSARMPQSQTSILNNEMLLSFYSV